jgi:hypothetical protein
MAKTKTKKKFALDVGPLFHHLGWQEIIRQIGVKSLIDEGGVKSMIDAVGVKGLIDEVGLSRLVSQLTPEQGKELQRLLEKTYPKRS